MSLLSGSIENGGRSVVASSVASPKRDVIFFVVVGSSTSLRVHSVRSGNFLDEFEFFFIEIPMGIPWLKFGDRVLSRARQ